MTGRRITIASDQDGRRLDKALAAQLGISRNEVQQQIQAKLVRDLDGKILQASQVVRVGHIVVVESGPRVLPSPVPRLPILYEDDDVLVVDKPAGLVVHTTESGRPQPTVAAFGVARGVVDSDRLRPGIVHRLDKDTSGAMVLAKHPAAKASLQRQFKQRTVQKTYLALVRGGLSQQRAVIELPLGRHRRQPAKRAVTPGARPARTEYCQLHRYQGATLVAIQLYTGRTHQIRVHFGHLGHPVVGDRLYGPRQQPAGLSRQFLHAAGLRFVAPSGKVVSVSSPLPTDLRAYLDGLPDAS